MPLRQLSLVSEPDMTATVKYSVHTRSALEQTADLHQMTAVKKQKAGEVHQMVAVRKKKARELHLRLVL